MGNKQSLTKTEKSWILYDVANSAFTMIITATIPIFFAMLTSNDGISAEKSTALWGFATSIAILILALMAPILGAIADYKDKRKKLFLFFLVLGVGGAIAFSLAPNWLTFLIFFVISRLGYSACNIFYDAMLVDVTTDENMDKISTYGYAWGYIGSCIPFIAGVIVLFLLGMDNPYSFQISFAVTLVWWILMSIPLLKNVKQVHYQEPRKDFVVHAFKRLGATFVKIRKNKALLFFIIAYFFYIDGVYTIISMATTYGSEVGLDSIGMVLALLVTQFVAFPCSILTGKLAKKYNPILLIKIFIVCYTGICIFGYFLDTQWEFWVLAVAVGTCQGGIQALSRSVYGKMIPKDESSEYFGFFDIFGKMADILGPILLSLAAVLFGSSKYGVLSLVLLFIVGYIFISIATKDTHPWVNPIKWISTKFKRRS